jgi:hypothetical protein
MEQEKQQKHDGGLDEVLEQDTERSAEGNAERLRGEDEAGEKKGQTDGGFAGEVERLHRGSRQDVTGKRETKSAQRGQDHGTS